MIEEKRWWMWQFPEDAKYIGKRGIPRKDAREKACGKAVYCRDICLPRMVYAKPLNSPFANAKIKKMDTSRAEKLPGVITILRWDDPVIKWPPTPEAPTGPRRFYPYLSTWADFYMCPVGAIVVAEDEETCDEALKILLEDTKWEEYPFVIDWDEALEKGIGEMMPPVDWEFGDIEEGFRQADRIVEFTVRKSEEDTWAGVEGGVAVAVWHGDKVEIWHYGHGPFGVKTILSEFYGIPESKIIVHAPYHGALFGGVTWLGYPDALAAIAALLARKIQRPVKILDDYTCFRGAEWQLGTYKFKIGFKNDGTITAVKLDTILVGQPLPEHTLVKLLKSTKIPNMAIHAEWPNLNRCRRMCYRHGSQHCNVLVYVINRVAAELGMDPTEVAFKNDGWHGHSMEWINEHIKKAEGFDPKRDSLKEVIEIGKKAIGWDEKWHPPGAKRLPNGKYHGIGFMAVEQWAWVPFTVGNLPRPISAGIRVNKDGSVEILGWRSDGGTAFSTAYCQVVADEIGVPYENIFHSHFDDHGFVLWQMGGSAGVVSNLIPIIAAARKVKRMILEYATQLLDKFRDKNPEELEIRDGFIFEKANRENKAHISEVARRITIFADADLYDYIEAIANQKPNEVYKRAAFQPRTFELIEPYAKPNLIRQAHFVEVEVDPETGKIDVTNAVVVNDVGTVINPDAVNGQQYGGA
ncbi:MAG: xanthine dehydrogenase family protein, partial [Candidatus Bathyarchaeia archaeon]